MMARGFFLVALTTTLAYPAPADHFTWGSSGGSSGGSSRGWVVHHGHHGSAGALRVRYYGGSWGMSSGRGSSGGYGSSGGSSGGSFTRARVLTYGSSGGQVDYQDGPIRRFLHRIHEPLHHHGSSGGTTYRSFGGSSGGVMAPSSEVDQTPKEEIPEFNDSAGSEPSDGLGSDDYEVTLEASNTADSSDAEVEDSKTVEQPQITSGTATLTISVPPSAEVIVNGIATESTGPVRHFSSVNLDEDKIYTYKIEVTYAINGLPRTEEASVKMRAGSNHELGFGTNLTSEVSDDSAEGAGEAGKSDTIVRVHVPEGARVLLAGKATESEGPIRTFKTLSLENGEIWNDYLIRVDVDIDGETVSKERLIKIVGGTESDYHFEFPAAMLATR